MFVVVFAHEGVACAALNEAAVYDAGRMGEVFTRFQGRREPVCLKERAWALELFVPLCGPKQTPLPKYPQHNVDTILTPLFLSA